MMERIFFFILYLNHHCYNVFSFQLAICCTNCSFYVKRDLCESEMCVYVEIRAYYSVRNLLG